MKLAFQSAQPRIEAEPISSHPDFDRGPRKAVMILLGTTAAFFVIFFAWMSFAPLDISVNAVGAVVPEGDLRAVAAACAALCASPCAPEACRERAARFEKRRQFARYVGLYQELCPPEPKPAASNANADA